MDLFETRVGGLQATSVELGREHGVAYALHIEGWSAVCCFFLFAGSYFWCCCCDGGGIIVTVTACTIVLKKVFSTALLVFSLPCVF